MFGSKQQVLGAKTVSPATVAAPKVINGSPEIPVVATEPAPKTPVLPSYEKVLGSQDAREGFKFDFLSFVAQDYYNLLQYAIYASILFIILLTFANLLLNFDLKHKDLFFKAVAFVVLLLIFVAVDKGVLLDLLPHDLNIY
jgi:hypothetical protein